MNEVKSKLEELAKNIFEINGSYAYSPTWNQSIDIFNRSLEIISYIKSQSNIDDCEYLALRKLLEELIKQGIDGPVTHIRSYKRNIISKLTEKAKAELEEIPYVEEETEIITLNDWIKSLKIFKLDGVYLSMDYYQTSYDLYQDMRKIILTKNSPIYKKIYLGMITSKIEDQNNKKKLPQSINLQVEDYELAELVKLIKENPEFNYRLMPWSYQKALINDRFERGEWKNNLLLLIKK